MHNITEKINFMERQKFHSNICNNQMYINEIIIPGAIGEIQNLVKGKMLLFCIINSNNISKPEVDEKMYSHGKEEL